MLGCATLGLARLGYVSLFERRPMYQNFDPLHASYPDILCTLQWAAAHLDQVIDELKAGQALMVQLLQRQQDDEHRNGGSHA
jgi:hypothetical protein